MPGTPILYDDWKDYDNRKSRDKCDSSTFSCETSWEVRYLISKIRKHHPFPEAAIRDAIIACSHLFPIPIPRVAFVQRVMQKLAGDS
jgi:hypothetical protein